MKIKSLLMMLLCLAAMTAVAAAGTVTVTFTSHTGALGGPTQGVYYYPYVITVNGSQLNVACDDYFDEIYVHNPGESWMATVNTFDAQGNVSGGLFAPGGARAEANSTTKYQQAAWLFSQLQPVPPLDNSVNAAINFAIWDLFDPNAQKINSNHPSSDTSSVYWTNLAANADLSNFDFSDFEIFTPVAGSWSSQYANAPQELIGEVPEPATGALLFTGVLLLAGLAWRRRACAEPGQA